MAVTGKIDRKYVTPLAGVWIEIFKLNPTDINIASLPLRECGLKSLYLDSVKDKACHSPCGSVD